MCIVHRLDSNFWKILSLKSEGLFILTPDFSSLARIVAQTRMDSEKLRISESLELLQASWSSSLFQSKDREIVNSLMNMETGIAQGYRGPVKSNFVQKWQMTLSKSDDWQWCWTATVNDRQSFYSATSIFAFGENVWAAASKGRFGLAVFRTAGLLETSKSRYCIG